VASLERQPVDVAADGNPHAAQHEAAGHRSCRRVAIFVDVEGHRIDEPSLLRVAEVEDADAGADVRLEITGTPDRQEADDGRERDNAKTQFLIDLVAELVDE